MLAVSFEVLATNQGGVLSGIGEQFSNLATRGQFSTDAEAAEYDAALADALQSGGPEGLADYLRANPAFGGTQGAIEAVAGGGNIVKTPGVKEFFGPKGPVFGNAFYRGKGNSGALNHGKVRIGWSYNQKSGRLNFSLRVGKWHSDKYFNPISIRAPAD